MINKNKKKMFEYKIGNDISIINNRFILINNEYLEIRYQIGDDYICTITGSPNSLGKRISIGECLPYLLRTRYIIDHRVYGPMLNRTTIF